MIGEYPTPALQEPESDSSYYGLRAPILGLQPRDDDSEQQRPTAPMTLVQTLFSALLTWITGEPAEVAGASVERAEDKGSVILEESVPLPAVSSQQEEPVVLEPCTKPFPVSPWTKIPRPSSHRPRWPVNRTFCEELRKSREDWENWARKQREERACKDRLISKEVAATADTSKVACSDHVDLHKAQLLERVEAAVPASATTDSLEGIHKDFVLEDQESESDEDDEDEEMPSSLEHVEEGLVIEDDENNLLFSSLVEALSAFTFNDQPVPGPCLFKAAPHFVAKSITSTETDEGEDSDEDFDAIVSELVLSIEGIEPVQGESVKQDPPLPAFAKPGPSVAASAAADAASSAAAAAAAAAVTVPMDSMATVTVTMPAGRAIAPMRKKKPSVTPVVVIAKPGPSVAASAAAAAAAAAVTVPMDSMATVTVTMPAGRAIAPMRKKKPSVTPVVVMPTDRPIAKPRARARGLNKGQDQEPRLIAFEPGQTTVLSWAMRQRASLMIHHQVQHPRYYHHLFGGQHISLAHHIRLLTTIMNPLIAFIRV